MVNLVSHVALYWSIKFDSSLNMITTLRKGFVWVMEILQKVIEFNCVWIMYDRLS